MVDDLVIRFAVASAQRLLPRARLILFGSRARGDHRLESDYDFAIDPKGSSASELVWFEDELKNNSPTVHKIDLVNLERCDQDLGRRIQEEGVVIYGQ